MYHGMIISTCIVHRFLFQLLAYLNVLLFVIISAGFSRMNTLVLIMLSLIEQNAF